MYAQKEQILSYLLKLISAKDKNLVAKTLDAFDGQISRSTVYNYLSELCERGIIKKSRGTYEIVRKTLSFTYRNNGKLEEDRIFTRDIEPLLTNLKKNVLSAWRYAFTEMMNNSIEHSNALTIQVIVETDALQTSISLIDDGIGIFKNIQQYMLTQKDEELTLKECATLLFAGKFTTAASAHSGEGIFFTSHLMDSFLILSDHVIFTRDNFSDAGGDLEKLDRGTLVIMTLNNQSNKTTREVFDRFSNVDEGFIKTQIPIAHIFSGDGPISRSEARRLGELILRFREVDLDFANVEEVGQAFAHELFIVWQTRNPGILLNVCNASEAVDNMIKRVKNTVS